MEEITAVLEKLEDAIRDISIPGTEELVTVIFQNAKVLDDINLTLNDILKELKKRNEKSQTKI